MLRVGAGTAKNIHLGVPQEGTRPVTDRIKLQVFDTLGPDLIVNAKVLDLFAGSGAYGIEALSRGAKSAVFIDSNPEAIRVIEGNLVKTNLQDKGKVIQGRLPRYLQKRPNNRLENTPEKPSESTPEFELIFCDPPFPTVSKQNYAELLKFAAPDAVAVVRIPSTARHVSTKLEQLERWEPLQSVEIGESRVHFLRWI